MSNNAVVPFSQHSVAAPAMPFGEMQQLASAIARSGLFGIKTPDQAIALMALAQAEGRHPATVARDYHIIGGSPAKKAEAMQRDFQSSGGKIEWHELTDEAVEATFSHPIGGTATIRWDTARCKQAGLLSGNHLKFPRQMKRSRVVSEGVRTVWPMATSGMYVPEEVAEFSAAPEPVDTRSELDRFATAKPAEIINTETGEVIDRDQIETDARAAAACGDIALRAFCQRLSDAEYTLIAPLVGADNAELRRIAREADAANLPHPDSLPGVEPIRHPTLGKDATLPEDKRSPETTPGGEPVMADMLGGEARHAVSHRFNLPRDMRGFKWQSFSDWVDVTLADGVSGRAIRADSQDALRLLKAADVDLYDAIQERLGK